MQLFRQFVLKTSGGRGDIALLPTFQLPSLTPALTPLFLQWDKPLPLS